LDRFDVAVTISPSAPLYTSRAEVFRLTGRYEEAAADIERALALDPRLAGAWREKALLSSAVEMWDEALSAVNKLVELEPDDGAAYAARAQIYAEGLGKVQQALTDYNRAVHHDSAFERVTLVERWYILAELRRWEEALRVSRMAAIANSQDPMNYFYQGWSLLQLGRLDEAIQVLFVGIDRYPDYPMALYYALGVAYYERHAWSEAIQALEVALLQSDPSSSGRDRAHPLDFTDSDILGRMGVAYLELKQCETGGAIVDRAISESPDAGAWIWARDRTEACYISLTPSPTPEDTQAP
jgi:tetratricopeptide (TPR) repeat protein